MARDVVDELLTGYPTVFYFIVSVFCFHLAALVPRLKHSRHS